MARPVAVIGSGVVGTAIAWHLQERGTQTILVDRDLETQGASAFSFASISAFDEPLRDVYLLKTLGIWLGGIGGRKWPSSSLLRFPYL